MTAVLARQLLARGHRVTLFAGEGSGAGWPRTVEHIPVEPLRLSPAARSDPSMPADWVMQVHHAYLQVALHLAERRDIDVVHNNSLHYLPLAMARTSPAPTLTTLHTPPTPWLESALQADTDPRCRFAAVSDFTARSWSHLVAADVVPNGVDTELWRPGPGGEDLVWTGRMVPEKAPHLAARAARLTGRRLVLAGPVSDEEYFRDVVTPELGTGVEYAGHLAHRDLVELVGASAVALVTPDWDEPFGLVAAEALACGTPVAGFARGGLPEVVAPTVGRLVPGGDVGALAAVVDEVAALDRRRCRSWAVRHLSAAAMAERYLARYAELERLRRVA